MEGPSSHLDSGTQAPLEGRSAVVSDQIDRVWRNSAGANILERFSGLQTPEAASASDPAPREFHQWEDKRKGTGKRGRLANKVRQSHARLDCKSITHDTLRL